MSNTVLNPMDRLTIQDLLVNMIAVHRGSIDQLKAHPVQMGGWSKEKHDARKGFWGGIFTAEGQLVLERSIDVVTDARHLELRESAQIAKVDRLVHLRYENPFICSTWQRRDEKTKGGAIVIAINTRNYIFAGAGLPSQMDHLIVTEATRRTEPDESLFLGGSALEYERKVRDRGAIIRILKAA